MFCSSEIVKDPWVKDLVLLSLFQLELTFHWYTLKQELLHKAWSKM